MTEGTTAPSAAHSAASAETTQANANQNAGKGQTTSAKADGATPRGPDTQAQAKGAEADAEAQARAEEFEEVKVGSVAGKVPKQLAKVIKDLERGFHAKAQEAAQAKGMWQQLAQQAKDNPDVADVIMERLGIDADQYSQARLAKKLQLEMMSPEQRKLMEYEQRVKTFEEQEAQRHAEMQKAHAERQYQEKSQEIRREVVKAVEQSPLIRDDAFLVAKVIATKAAAEKQGLDWTWEDCVSKIESEFRSVLKSRTSTLSPEQVEEFLGQEALSKWREYDLQRVTQKATQQASKAAAKSPGAQASVSKQDGPKRAMTESEYREYFNRLAQG